MIIWMHTQLFYREMGDGLPIVILHGLFGSGDNWSVVGKGLASGHRVFLVDLRNHGHSFHHPVHDYLALAQDVVRLLDALGLGTVTIVGHSMGGKVAMQVAQMIPNRVRRLVIVDILPMDYPDHHRHIFNGLKRVPLTELTRRSDADTHLSADISDPALRAFLIKSLVVNDDGAQWRFNLDVLLAEYQHILATPQLVEPSPVATTFILGGRSEYVQPDGVLAAAKWFPNREMVTIPGAGHWVHAENPKQVVEIIAGR